jgi:thiol-disulfide isomerase/thioredoxin
MPALASGSTAPDISGVSFSDGPKAVFFYKVTCPVCQMAAPAAQAIEAAYPGRILGVGQDPEEKLVAFDREYGMGFPRQPDLPPYDVSNAYGVEVVPTVFVVQDSTVLDTVESWDRDGYNRVSRRLAELTGTPFVEISTPGDGLPPFRPG